MISQDELLVWLGFCQQIDVLLSMRAEWEKSVIKKLARGDTIEPGECAPVVIGGSLTVVQHDTPSAVSALPVALPSIDTRAHACDHGGVDGQET